MESDETDYICWKAGQKCENIFIANKHIQGDL